MGTWRNSNAGIGEERKLPPQPVLRYSDGVDPAWLPGAGECWPQELPHDADGRLDVHQLIGAQHWLEEQPLVVVVTEDLHAKGCASLFGFAAPDARVAVVSTSRLQTPDLPLFRERLAKVIAHEWMHLAGRRHCPHRGCLMHPVASVEELDARGDALCERCQQLPAAGSRWPWRGIAVAIAIVIALSGGMDLTVKALQTKSTPFHTQRSGEAMLVRYQDEEVLRIAPNGAEREGARQQAQELSAQLNRLFGDIDAPLLTVQPRGETAVVLAAGTPILTVDAGMAGGESPEAFARHWAARWNPILQAKGRPEESCPDCHVRRRAQVREAVARPPRFWR